MTVTLSPADVLADISGWDSSTWTELTGGLTNKIWQVVNGHRKGVLKIDEESRVEPFNTRCKEAQVQTLAARRGLAPNVIMASDTVYFTEYVEGTVWNKRHLDQEGSLERLAAALKQLHALPLTGRSFDASVAAKRYVRKIRGLDSTVVERCTEIISRMRLPQNLCCCHNDLVAENIISTPDLMFLDWEYACDNDPFFDLATVVEHHELDESQAARILNAYFDGDGERWRENLQQQRKLYLALLCLWMGARPDCDPIELDRVVQRLSTSYF